MGYIMTEDVLKNSNVQQLLQSKEKYDVVIIPQFLNEGLLGIGCHYKTPVVLIAPMPLFAWGSFVLGLPSPSSYVPNLLTPYTGHMDFWQRFYNTFYDICSILYHQYIILPKHRELVRRYIPTKPDLYSFLNNASLLLVNSHVSSYDATLQVPNVVEIGGLHIKEPKKLPHDLQEFLDNSKNGVILFSMGSNLKSSSLDGKKRNAILGAFSKLKEKVLWKWENDSLPGQPKNVRLMKWVPQCDVLAHPNVKIFITHGGLFSTMESIYHGVPAIGIPVFSDQKLNMATAVSNGYALVVPFDKLTESKLSNAINEVLNNPKYKNNAMKRSKIIKDRPVKPLDHAIYSIEYVIRHQGASHLRYSGMDLNWYQRNVLDVVGLVLITLVATLCLICIALKKICNLWLTEERIIKKMN
ncbi:UDP-glycosyltransferase UGT5-like isoform X2 [Zophobas morio]